MSAIIAVPADASMVGRRLTELSRKMIWFATNQFYNYQDFFFRKALKGPSICYSKKLDSGF